MIVRYLLFYFMSFSRALDHPIYGLSQRLDGLVGVRIGASEDFVLMQLITCSKCYFGCVRYSADAVAIEEEEADEELTLEDGTFDIREKKVRTSQLENLLKK